MGDPLPPGQDSLQSILNLHRDFHNENVPSTSGPSSGIISVHTKYNRVHGRCLPLSLSLDASASQSHTNDTDSNLKREYLRLLPTSQIIEICLTFDPHVPVHVKSAIWPADLNASIAALQLQQSVPSLFDDTAQLEYPPDEAETACSSSDKPNNEDLSQQVNPPNDGEPLEPMQIDPPEPAEGPPIEAITEPSTSESNAVTEQTDSIVTAQQTLQKVLEELSRSTTPIQAAAAVASPVSPTPAKTLSSTTATTSQLLPEASTSQTPAQPASQTPTPSHPNTPHPTHPTHPVPPQAPYAYHPYGYPIPGHPGHAAQHAYPHTPYYGPHPGYAAAYPGYPPYPPQPGYPPPASIYGTRPPMAHIPPPPPPHHPTPTAVAAPPPPPPTGDDLPSYEDMIVEALLDMPDPEGAAPRDLFNWMEARYPLQTNFRPSASQALQKAFKRGRLEKRLGGKYRLNATWEGGAVSRQFL